MAATEDLRSSRPVKNEPVSDLIRGRAWPRERGVRYVTLARLHKSGINIDENVCLAAVAFFSHVFRTRHATRAKFITIVAATRSNPLHAGPAINRIR